LSPTQPTEARLPSPTFTDAPRERKIERVLVVRFGAFGDMVLLTPMIQRLRERFGVNVDILSSGPWTVPLLQSQPGVGEIKLLHGRRVPFALNWTQWSALRWLRARASAPTWFCQTDSRARDLVRRAGIRDEMVCEFSQLPLESEEHFAAMWARFADSTPPALAGVCPSPTTPRYGRATLTVTPQARAALRPWLEKHRLLGSPLVLIQAGNKRTMRPLYRKRRSNKKYWPEHRWAQVIRAVSETRPDAKIVLLGSKGEHRLNEEIRRRAAVSHLYNVASDLPIDTLLPLLELADSMITVDTGPAHAAAALGCPQVTLFANADPLQYFPGGIGSAAIVLTGEIDDSPNIMAIEASTVIQAWSRLPARSLATQVATMTSMSLSPSPRSESFSLLEAGKN
jgi:heptosyltransferase-2/heptosyltransferase-3